MTKSYINTVAEDSSPWAFWLLDDESGTIAKEYMKEYSVSLDGAYINGPTLNHGPLLGTNRSVITNADLGAYMTFPKPPDLPSNFGVEFWFQWVNGTAPLFRDSRSGAGGWFLSLSGTHPVLRAGPNEFVITSLLSTDLKDDSSHTILFGGGSGTVRLYIDGDLVLNVVAGGDSGDFHFPLVLGRDGLNPTYSNVMYAAVAIYPYIPDPADHVTAKYNHLLKAPEPIQTNARLLVVNQTVSLHTAPVEVTASALDYSLSHLYALGHASETVEAIGPSSFKIEGVVGNVASGVVEPDAEAVVFEPTFEIEVLDTNIRRAPSAITVTVSGGLAGEDITFRLDAGLTPSGQDEAYTTQLDSSGSLGPTSISVYDNLGGQQGDRTVTAVQTGTDGLLSASATYHVARTPIVYPAVMGADADPVLVDGALVGDVRNWVLQDLLGVEEGGIGSFILPYNPARMDSPHLEFVLTTKHTTAKDGPFHVFQAGEIPKDWTFGGQTWDEEMLDELRSYRALNRRFYVIDHHNRAWKVVWTNLEIVPHLRQEFNGEITDLGTDWTVTATVLDQDPKAPV